MQKVLNGLTQFWNLIKNLLKKFPRFMASVYSVLIGILIGFIVMLIFNPQGAFPGLIKMFAGGLTIGNKGIGDMLLQAAPIILTGTALVITFKSGLFNIGASGQMIVGAYVATHIGVLWDLPSGLHWIVALILGTLAGTVWGAIPGLLKAFRNVNEVVSSIMLNYIGMFLVIYLVKTNIYNASYAKSQDILQTAELPLLSFLFGSSKANIGIFIAIFVAIIIHFIFKYTVLGYELKATGFNPEASRYVGMNSKRNIVVSFILSGSLAGLAGAIQFLVVGTNLGITHTLLPGGFDGISVALLGQLEPIGAVIAGIFLSHIRLGGFYMQVHGFPPQIIEIIVAIIVYTTSISAGISLYLRRRKAKKQINQQKVGDGE